MDLTTLKSAITQTLTYEVINYYVPTGSYRLLSTKLDFIPKFGDIITFGESYICYTIIDILHLEVQHKNDINLWTIDLDRPLEKPIQADRAGFVTETVHLLRKMPLDRLILDNNLKCVTYA